jgi:hypothetical protein
MKRYAFPGLLMVLASALAGCADTAAPVWTKEGATPNELKRDRVECLQASQQTNVGNTLNPYGGTGQGGTSDSALATCMKAHGWSQQGAPDAQAESDAQQQQQRAAQQAAEQARLKAQHASALQPQQVVITRQEDNHYLTSQETVIETLNCHEPANKSSATLFYDPDPSANAADNKLEFRPGVSCPVDIVIR